MLSIDWRSPAAYRFARSIPAAGFAWEYLRRDDEYRREFQTIIAVFVSERHSTSLEAIERWSPKKLLAYFEKSCELSKIMRQ